MKHRHTFDHEPLHVRAALAYGRSDMDQIVDEIIATESIMAKNGYRPELF